jgi:predicted alpha/beta-hydrolase family hydrolase
MATFPASAARTTLRLSALMDEDANNNVAGARFSIEVGEAKTTAVVYPAGGGNALGAKAVLILGHGAGAPQSHPWMVGMARAIAGRGVDVVTFNFLYTEAKRRAPDRNDVLEATWRAVLESVRARTPKARVFIGGKSMGGRIASQIAAQEDVDVAGVVLLGYPLHPPGQREKLRVAHLPRVRAPMLFVQGSRDAFGSPDELSPYLRGMPAGTRLLPIEGGDHSLALPRGKGVDPAAMMARVADEVARFVTA